MNHRCIFLWLALFLTVGVASAQDRRDEEREAAKYYDKWLNQDVVYIISDEERQVFDKLTTSEEKDIFIEEFWRRRDTDLRTAVNEFKEEHYRRIAYANREFGSGIPGWKTDRGRIYIMFGEPAQVEYYAGGGTYVRPGYEGGGRTATYPFELWRYRHLEGVGDDVEIEFVDRSWTGEFKIAQWPWEKDMLLHVDGLGETTAERLGLARRYERPGLHFGHINNTAYMTTKMGQRFKDRPFERIMQYFNLQKAPKIHQIELQTLVDTKVTYDKVPFTTFHHHIWVDENSALVPFTVEVPNSGLQYERLGNLVRARVAFYGRVTSLLGQVVAEFEDSVASEYRAEHLEIGRTQKSLYQKTFLLAPGNYKLDLVVKDLGSGNVGTRTQTFLLKKQEEGRMSASSIVLAKKLEALDSFPEKPESFVLGDIRVIPQVDRKFKSTDEVGVYLQVYNPGLDSSSLEPAVSIHYTISDGDRVLAQLTDKEGASIEYVSPQRLVLVRKMVLDGLEKGIYRLVVEVEDAITGQTSSSETDFEVLG